MSGHTANEGSLDVQSGRGHLPTHLSLIRRSPERLPAGPQSRSARSMASTRPLGAFGRYFGLCMVTASSSHEMLGASIPLPGYTSPGVNMQILLHTVLWAAWHSGL